MLLPLGPEVLSTGMPTAQINALIALLLNAILGAVVAARDPRSAANRWYALLCASVATWSLVVFLGYNYAATPKQAGHFFAAATPGWAFMVPCYLMFVRAYVGVDGIFRTLFLPKLFLVTGVVLSVLVWVPGAMVEGMVRVPGQAEYLLRPGPFYYALSVPHVALGMLAGLLYLGTALRRASDPLVRRRTLVLIVAMAAPVLGAAVPLLTRTEAGQYAAAHVAIPLTAVHVVIVGAGMLRYRLFALGPESAAQTIVQTMKDGLLLTDRDARVEYSNPAAWEIFDIEPNVIQGRTLPDLIRPREEMSRAVELASQGRQVNGEGSIRTRSGETVPVEYTISASRDHRRGPVRGLVCVVRDVGPLRELIHDLQEASERLEHMAITDPLTGVYNRRYLEARIEDEFHASGRYQRPFTVVMLDLDRFKEINDRLGHDAGDRVLRAVARTLSSGVRGSDVVTRYGGDEFVIVMPETGVHRAMEVAERLRSKIRTVVPQRGSELSASFGVATYDGRGGVMDAAELLRLVDDALLRSKDLGRDCVQVVDLEARARHKGTPTTRMKPTP